ncbi:MAG: carboxypeptidase-like regulatory domain-containing protein [Niastella sp.]|nr:carboxypeptidase-like regulatory domain-containing protein [Niastella sp.]
MFKPISLSLICVSFAIISHAQFTVTGIVTDGTTQKPMQGASVFADNTTLGTTTDSDGRYQLWLPKGGYDLSVTFTGYTSESKRVSSNDNAHEYDFTMRPKEKEMEEVAVVSSSEVKDGWQKYGGFFMQEFIGNTPNAAACKILNPEILKFYFSKKRNRLKVLANEPILVENKALGYQIKYALDSFTHEYNTEVSLYTGNPLFKELIAESDSQYHQWQEARLHAYQGSMLHFMRSLFNQSLAQEGFEIQFLVKVNGTDSALKLKNVYAAMHYEKDDSTQTVEVYPNQNNVGIIYIKEKPSKLYLNTHPDEPGEFQFSMLTFKPDELIVIEQNGYYYDQNDITVSQYWAWSRLAESLPYDFSPQGY